MRDTFRPLSFRVRPRYPDDGFNLLDFPVVEPVDAQTGEPIDGVRHVSVQSPHDGLIEMTITVIVKDMPKQK